MFEWGAPRQLGILADWGHHALAEAALGAGDFEDAYHHAPRSPDLAPCDPTLRRPSGPRWTCSTPPSTAGGTTRPGRHVSR